MNSLLQLQQELQTQSKELLSESKVLELLNHLGTPIQTGSSVTGLMIYPDIDFAVHNQTPELQTAIELVPRLFSELSVTSVKIADFSAEETEGAAYYIGFDMPYAGRTWHIDATISRPGPITTNPPELAHLIEQMSEAQREIILGLKRELIDAKRYVGARSQPPYTFRSVHLYEAVLKGGASTIAEVEAYFSNC
ncbi:hypothetical protein CYG49_01940 [Candidatus Saccharibacteria bacterium]|nr:MAG: hypothetical protein CYG49_01940 [Candidatus Saccharibacteria bacterium]